MGTCHQPHSAPSCELALRTVGAARGRPGGDASCLDVGRPGLGALPTPTARPLGRGLVPNTNWLWMRGLWARGPATNPSARALASWLCALWWRHEGTRGGRLLPARGASGVGRSPTPYRSDRLMVRGVWAWGPVTNPERALLLAGFARSGGGRRAPRGGASYLGVGRLGSGALPPPTARPLGRAAGAHYPLAVGAGGAGVGTPHRPHSARSCVAGFARCGGGTRAPGGAPFDWAS